MPTSRVLLLPLLLVVLWCETTAVDALRLSSQMGPVSVSSAVWTPVALDANIVQIALDAVSYRANYDRSVATRLCLYRITSVKTRVASSITSYLLSVDGCVTLDVVSTGICDIYFCRLYSFELRLAQKSANNGVYIVQSVTKLLTQKSLSDLMLPGNLDIVDQPGSDSSPSGSPEEAKASSSSSSHGNNISTRADARPSPATLLSMVQTANAVDGETDESPMQLVLQWLWHWW